MIYLLEDDATIRNFVGYALENSGFNVKSFEKPSLLWQALEERVPKLLLLDVMLPEEDGYKVCQSFAERLRPQGFLSLC